ncbi:MAG: hypothetical protein WDO74_07935 [Pseudomonadota bacterium]
MTEQHFTGSDQVIRAVAWKAPDARVGDAVAKAEMFFATRQVRGDRVEHGDHARAVSAAELRADELLNAHPIFGVRVAFAREHREQAVHWLFGPSPTPVGGALSPSSPSRRARLASHMPS